MNFSINRCISWTITYLRKFSWSRKIIDEIIRDKDITELVRWSWLALVFKFVSLPLWLLISLLISRWYGVDWMWTYSLTITIISIIVSFWLLWLSSSLPRLVWESRANKLNDQKKIYTSSLVLVSILGIVFFFILQFLSGWIANTLLNEPHLEPILNITSRCILPIMIWNLNYRYLIASKKIFFAEILSKCIIPIWTLSILVLWNFLLSELYIPVNAYIIPLSLSAVVSLYIMIKKRYIAFTWSLFNIKKILGISVPMLITTIWSTLILKSDIIMVWIFASTDVVGVYTITYAIASLITIPQTVISLILGPKISEIFYANKIKELKKLLKTWVMLISLGSLIIFIILQIFSKTILSWYGESFVDWKNTLLLFSFWLFFGALTWSTSTYLNNTWREKITLRLTIFALCVNIVWNYLLIPYYWMIWSALVSIILLFLINMFAIRYIHKEDWIYIDIRSLIF